MKNKPYAWVNVNDEYKILFDDELPNYYPEAWIPLYTHPVKELTDEEIEDAKKSCKRPLATWEWQKEFARAILRKAQKK